MAKRSNPMPMTEKERMLNALFPAKGEGAQHTTNIKFFLGDDRNITEEDLCKEFNQALQQEQLGMTNKFDTLDRDVPRATVSKFIPE